MTAMRVLEDNETDAIVQQSQISLFKEKSQVNSYLELYQVVLRLRLSLINSVCSFPG